MSYLSLGFQALYMRMPSGDVTWLTQHSGISLLHVQFSGLSRVICRHMKPHSRMEMGKDCQLAGTVCGPARRPHFSLATISVTVQLWTQVFWVISVYFNIRNTLPKSDIFLLGHSVYILLGIRIPPMAIFRGVKMNE